MYIVKNVFGKVLDTYELLPVARDAINDTDNTIHYSAEAIAMATGIYKPDKILDLAGTVKEAGFLMTDWNNPLPAKKRG